MEAKRSLLSRSTPVREAGGDEDLKTSDQTFMTRDHEIIREWAARYQAEPATGEATLSGPATVRVVDGGAGIRFNFPGASMFRPISWEEWFAHFEHHQLAFVFDQPSGGASPRYRLVRAAEWEDVTRS